MQNHHNKAPYTPPHTPTTTTSNLAVIVCIPVLLLGLVAGIGIGYSLWGVADPNTIANTERRTTTASSEPPAASNAQSDESPNLSNNYGYRGGEDGVQLTESADTVAKNIIESLELSLEQSGQYPGSFTVYQSQILWKYGYNSMTAGPNLKCPADNGHFSYQAFKDQRTATYTSYDLYYCNGSDVVQKSSSDIHTPR